MEALAGLLNEFRHGNIVALSAEEKGMERHAGSLSARWNNRFPGFPINHFPYTSFRAVAAAELVRRRDWRRDIVRPKG